MKDANAIRVLALPRVAIRKLVVNPEGTRLLLLGVKECFVWHIPEPTLGPKSIRNEGQAQFTDVAFHPSGRYLAATSNDTTVNFYDTESWQVAKTFTWNVGRLRSIAFSPDGTLAAVGSDTGKIVVWDVDV